MGKADLSRLLGLWLALGPILSATDLNVHATTFVQHWKWSALDEGEEAKQHTPLTQFLSVDARNMADGHMGLYLYGWGQTDLSHDEAEVSPLLKKRDGDLVYGFVNYVFDKANGEIKAGRLFVNEAGTVECLDGLQAGADLKGGFNLTVFGGKPHAERMPESWKRDWVAGARLGLRLKSSGMLSVSFLGDGPKVEEDPENVISPYPARQLASAEFHWLPTSHLEIQARGAYHLNLKENAMQEYALGYRLASWMKWHVNFVDRNYRSFFAGTNLPLLFRQDTLDKIQRLGTRINLGQVGSSEFLLDYASQKRERYGKSQRYGMDMSVPFDQSKIKLGLGYHRVQSTADDVVDVVPDEGLYPFYNLSHHEARFWIFLDGKRLTGSLDFVCHRYDEKDHPYLYGKNLMFEGLASVGYQIGKYVKVSADVSYGSNVRFEPEWRSAFRIEYRLGGQ